MFNSAKMSEPDEAWPDLPTETEIYILPNGEIVIADLPAELAASLAMLLPNEEGLSPAQPDKSHVTD